MRHGSMHWSEFLPTRYDNNLILDTDITYVMIIITMIVRRINAIKFAIIISFYLPYLFQTGITLKSILTDFLHDISVFLAKDGQCTMLDGLDPHFRASLDPLGSIFEPGSIT